MCRNGYQRTYSPLIPSKRVIKLKRNLLECCYTCRFYEILRPSEEVDSTYVFKCNYGKCKHRTCLVDETFWCPTYEPKRGLEIDRKTEIQFK